MIQFSEQTTERRENIFNKIEALCKGIKDCCKRKTPKRPPSNNPVNFLYCLQILRTVAGREIAPNTGANTTKFFTLATKS